MQEPVFFLSFLEGGRRMAATRRILMGNAAKASDL